VNAKASKFTDKSESGEETGGDTAAESSEGDKKPRRGRSRKKAE
jgi:hypothetical protein